MIVTLEGVRRTTDRVHYNLKNKSSHPGFIDCIRSIFFSRSKFFIDFSRSIACRISVCSSKYPNLSTPYFFVKPSKAFSLCCITRFFKSLVTPTYKVPFFLLNRIYVYPFFCISGKVQKRPLKNNGFKWLGFYRPRRGLQNDKKVISRHTPGPANSHRPSSRRRVSWTSPGRATSRRGLRLRG